MNEEQKIVGLSDRQIGELGRYIYNASQWKDLPYLKKWFDENVVRPPNEYVPDWNDVDKRTETITVVTTYKGRNFQSLDFTRIYKRPKKKSSKSFLARFGL
jgi:hypothetical protein